MNPPETSRVRWPLYARILGWLVLNLLVLALLFYGFFRIQFRFGLDSLLVGRAGDRIQAVSELISFELSDTPRSQWNTVLERFSSAYRLQFYLFRADGTQEAGEPINLPREVARRVGERPMHIGPLGTGERPGGFRRGLGPPPGAGPNSGLAAEPPEEAPTPQGPGRGAGLRHVPEPRPKFMQRTSDPDRYWVGVRLPLTSERPRPAPLILLAVSDSLRGGGLFLDLTPWVVVAFVALLVSVLFWIPIVRGITHAVSQMHQATESIAEGRFDARVPGRRGDELGRLARAINRMAGRLEGFVHGQKRFLGDIAHELGSPLGRIQMSLGILEQRADERQKAHLEDLREEVQQMSELVNELLSFTRAGLQQEVRLQAVPLAGIVKRVVAREGREGVTMDVQVDETLVVQAEPELLARALGNLLRNAVRYAGAAGPIRLAATVSHGKVLISVEDSGPGVPEDALERIFDPFYRVEASRSRESGGVGLGLAIVRTCVEACGGSVRALNRKPNGLRVEIALSVGTAGG